LFAAPQAPGREASALAWLSSHMLGARISRLAEPYRAPTDELWRSGRVSVPARPNGRPSLWRGIAKVTDVDRPAGLRLNKRLRRRPEANKQSKRGGELSFAAPKASL